MMNIFKKKTEAEKRAEEIKQELEFKTAMNGVKRGFDKGISQIDVQIKTIANQIQTYKSKGDVKTAMTYMKHHKLVTSWKNKLISNRSKVDLFINMAAVIRSVSVSLGGLGKISGALNDAAGKMNFTDITNEVSTGITSFKVIEEQFNTMTQIIEEHLGINDDDDDDNVEGESNNEPTAEQLAEFEEYYASNIADDLETEANKANQDEEQKMADEIQKLMKIN